MSAFTIPAKAASGILTVGSVDLTCYIRRAGFSETEGTSIDVGTWCSPEDVSKTPGTRDFTVQFRNSFSDGTTDGAYDALKALADGTTKAVVFQPFGSGADHPKWTFDTVIPEPPTGEFAVGEAVISDMTWGIQNYVYVKSTKATP